MGHTIGFASSIDSKRERETGYKVRYQIVGEELLNVSSLFIFIENKKEELRLADYGISQTSLEQVFNMHIAGI